MGWIIFLLHGLGATERVTLPSEHGSTEWVEQHCHLRAPSYPRDPYRAVGDAAAALEAQVVALDRYRRELGTFREMNLGDWVPLDQAIPDSLQPLGRLPKWLQRVPPPPKSLVGASGSNSAHLEKGG